MWVGSLLCIMQIDKNIFCVIIWKLKLIINNIILEDMKNFFFYLICTIALGIVYVIFVYMLQEKGVSAVITFTQVFSIIVTVITANELAESYDPHLRRPVCEMHIMAVVMAVAALNTSSLGWPENHVLWAWRAIMVASFLRCWWLLYRYRDVIEKSDSGSEP